MWDLTPGFNLGVSDTVKKVTTAGNSAGSAPATQNNKLGITNPGIPSNTGGLSNNGNLVNAAKNIVGAGPSGTLGAQVESGAYTGTSGSAGAGGSGGGSATSAADLAYIADQEGLLQQMLSRLGTSEQQGMTQIGDDYNRLVNSANGQRSNTLSDLETRTQDTTRDKLGALDKVDTNARTLSNSVRQILAGASGSGSSAYQLTAPGAVAREATQERSGVQDTFGKNFRDLDTTKTRAKSEFDGLLADLERQRAEKTSGLRNGVLTQQQDVLGNLADLARQKAAISGGGYSALRAASAPYQAQISDRQSQIDSLFNQYRTPFDVKAVNVQAPTLADYTVDRAGLTVGGGAGGDTTASPYARFLRQAQDEKQVI